MEGKNLAAILHKKHDLRVEEVPLPEPPGPNGEECFIFFRFAAFYLPLCHVFFLLFLFPLLRLLHLYTLVFKHSSQFVLLFLLLHLCVSAFA